MQFRILSQNRDPQIIRIGDQLIKITMEWIGDQREGLLQEAAEPKKMW